MALTFYNAYKVRSGTINVRKSYSTTSSIVGTCPSGNFYLYYSDIHVSAQSSKDYFIYVPAYGGWVACSSLGSTYINYGLSVYQGSAYARYWWPTSASAYESSYFVSATRTSPGFTTRSNGKNSATSFSKTGSSSTITLTASSRGSTYKTISGKKTPKTTYTLKGWRTSKPSNITTSSTYGLGKSVSSKSDLNLYAVFNTGTTSYSYSGNTVNTTNCPNPSNYTNTGSSYTVTYSGATGYTSASAKITKTYVFDYWKNSSGTKISLPYTFTSTQTITAVFKLSKTSVASIILPTPTKSGYDFLGWSTSSTATTGTYKGGSSYTPSGNVTLYAVWKLSNYTITYNHNDGSGTTFTSSHANGTTATLTSVIPTRAGYTFKGWSKSSSAKFPSYYSKVSSGDITSATSLYAVWWPNFDWINYNYSEWQTFVTNCYNYLSTSLTTPSVYYNTSEVNILRTAFSLSSIAANAPITKAPLDELEAKWDIVNGGY